MNQSYLPPLVSVLLANVLYLLRRWQLSSSVDADGILLTNTPATWTLLAATAVAALIWLVWSRRLAPAAALDDRRDPFGGVVQCLGALAIAVSSAATLYRHLQMGATFDLLVDCAGVVAALCLCVSGILRLQGRPGQPVIHIIPYLFLILRLISDFRGWSSDPIILDYCFRHFGLIFSLCGLYQIASFSFGQGNRRWATFFAMGAVGCCVAAMPGISTAELLLYGGLALTMLGAQFQLSTAKA